MKKEIVLLAASVLLLANSTIIAQTMKREVPLTFSANRLTCKLTNEEFQKRKAKLQEEVFANVKIAEELENGYAFYFQHDEDHLISLVDYMLAENKCCPFFQQDLTLLPNNGGLIWKLTGNEQVKDLLDAMSDFWN